MNFEVLASGLSPHIVHRGDDIKASIAGRNGMLWLNC
jgi:hypothetical protein